MTTKKDLKDIKKKLADAAGWKERIESDQVVRWDGKKLYVVERVFHGENHFEDRHKDVSEDIAKAISKLLGS